MISGRAPLPRFSRRFSFAAESWRDSFRAEPYFRMETEMTLAHLVRSSAVAALVLTLSMPAWALDRRVTIINDTNFDIVEFYGSQVDAKTWEEDVLGSDILRAGASVDINFDDGTGYCMFDFRAIFDDGDELIRKNINVCEVGTYRYHE
jgi:hypothetical protein